MIKNIAKESIIKALELAYEKAELEYDENKDEVFIDKQSIISVIDLVE